MFCFQGIIHWPDERCRCTLVKRHAQPAAVGTIQTRLSFSVKRLPDILLNLRNFLLITMQPGFQCFLN